METDRRRGRAWRRLRLQNAWQSAAASTWRSITFGGSFAVDVDGYRAEPCREGEFLIDLSRAKIFRIRDREGPSSMRGRLSRRDKARALLAAGSIEIDGVGGDGQGLRRRGDSDYLAGKRKSLALMAGVVNRPLRPTYRRLPR